MKNRQFRLFILLAVLVAFIGCQAPQIPEAAPGTDTALEVSTQAVASDRAVTVPTCYINPQGPFEQTLVTNLIYPVLVGKYPLTQQNPLEEVYIERPFGAAAYTHIVVADYASGQGGHSYDTTYLPMWDYVLNRFRF